jgi:hypothetical protein
MFDARMHDENEKKTLKQSLYRAPTKRRGLPMMKNRYYVQPLTNEIFIIRERISDQKGPGPNDRVVRSFKIRHDAYSYAKQMNTISPSQTIQLNKDAKAVAQSV